MQSEGNDRSAADNTAEKQSNLKPWRKGQSGNPKGRPKGSRNKLNEAFIGDLNEAWETYGIEALTKCAKEEPVAFCKIVAGLMPSKIDSTLTVTADFESLADFAKSYQIARQLVGLEEPSPMLLELEAIEVEPDDE